MKSNILSYIIVPLLATAMLSACTDYVYPASPEDGEGKVIVNYSCTGLQTRAEDSEEDLGEEPWGSPWYEMKIYRLDLFLFNDKGELLHHYGNPYDGTRDGTFPTDLTAKQVTDLNPATCYLIANCPSVANIKSLSALQDAEIDPTNGDPKLNYNQKQEQFVMTAMLTGDQIVHGGSNSTKDITMNFKLERVAAKIVLLINYNDNGGSSVEGIVYRMFNCATQAKVLPSISTEGEYEESVQYDSWLYTTTNPDFIELSNNSDNIRNEGRMYYVVFYSYPTDWFDMDKVKNNGDGTYIVDFSAPPVKVDGNNETKECYIMLRARWPAAENGEYYQYKIPVNYRLPDYNDQKVLTETEYQDVRDLYRLKRNHVYRINVTIGIEGGVIEDPEQPQLSIKVDDWSGNVDNGDRIVSDITFDKFE